MSQEDRKLLLKDLSARLTYGVKVTWDGKHPVTVTPHIYCAIANENNIDSLPKLLLRPMSSMTEEEKLMYEGLMIGTDNVSYMSDVIDWLNEHYFDYQGLIEKGLAIEVTEENNPYENI